MRWNGKYYIQCPKCRRKLEARSIVVLELRMVEHAKFCLDDQAKRQRRLDERREAAAAQLDLFGGNEC